jgi:hypothetical protein
VDNGIKPETARHLFFLDVGPSHVNNRLPMGFDQPIGRLALGRGGNHLRSVIDKILADGSTKKFAITIAVEATGKRARRRTKFPYCRQNLRRRKTLQTKGPVIAGSPINKNEGIAKALDTDAIPKRDVHMDCIKVFVPSLVERATALRFRNRSV